MQQDFQHWTVASQVTKTLSPFTLILAKKQTVDYGQENMVENQL